jgi:hypothetical protein
MLKVFIGYDGREVPAYQVCVRSLVSRCSAPVEPQPLMLAHLQAARLYTRPTTRDAEGRLFDTISAHPMATEHAIARFLVPHLARHSGWALSCDADILWRGDAAELFALADPAYAVMVVKHDHRPPARRKMDGQVQSEYPRKNWSSVILWNCAHPAHRRLTLGMINDVPGRDLHAFSWLADGEIGALPEAWNWLEGHSAPELEAKAAHFTRGTPDMPGYGNTLYAGEWWRVLEEIHAGTAPEGVRMAGGVTEFRPRLVGE